MNYSSQTFNRTIYTLESTVLMHLCIVPVFLFTFYPSFILRRSYTQKINKQSLIEIERILLP